MDYHGLPQISIDFLTNRKYSWISMDPGNLQIHGKSKIFWISTGNPNYHWVSHTKCRTRKTYHSALCTHIFYTSSNGKTVGVEFQQIILFFIGRKAKTTKNQNKPSEYKKPQHEHNNPTCSVSSYWSTDSEEVSTGYCYFQAVVEEQVWSHPDCLLCSLGLLGGGMTTDTKQSSTKASLLESHAATNICR